MQKHLLSLAISADNYVQLYSGKVKNVRAVTENGLRVEFPGSILHRFVTHQGVYGRFQLCIDEKFKLQSIERL